MKLLHIRSLIVDASETIRFVGEQQSEKERKECKRIWEQLIRAKEMVEAYHDVRTRTNSKAIAREILCAYDGIFRIRPYIIGTIGEEKTSALQDDMRYIYTTLKHLKE